jgi:hypothetical protein
MKNLHVLPTDKPTRLWTNNLRRRLELDEFPERHPTNIAKHIYITSDEEIQDGDWVFFVKYKTIHKAVHDNHFEMCNGDCKKIILTTDQDLIKNGVQEISEEFLEWFVKNPSCKEVDVMTDAFTVKEMSMLPLGTRNLKYKIIIPQEEPKQFTLEEAAEKYSQELLDAKTIQPHEKTWIKSMFIYIANWQAKKMYSEEEVQVKLYECLGHFAQKHNIIINGIRKQINILQNESNMFS